MLYGNHTSLTFENVKSNLLSKEKLDVDSRSESKGEGFIVRGRTQQAGCSNKPKSRSKSRDRKSNNFCHYCKADNHVISQCPKLKNMEERQNKNESDKSDAEASIVENNDGGEALMITDEDITSMYTMNGPITRSRARQLNLQVRSTLVNYVSELTLGAMNVLMIRNLGENQQGLGKGQCVGGAARAPTTGRRSSPTRLRLHLGSRTSLH
jgi:hypothetical protein